MKTKTYSASKITEIFKQNKDFLEKLLSLICMHHDYLIGQKINGDGMIESIQMNTDLYNRRKLTVKFKNGNASGLPDTHTFEHRDANYGSSEPDLKEPVYDNW
jgi:hypothetical protein